MRTPKENDFFIELPDVGSFRFGRRTFLDRAKIRAEYLHFTREFGDDDAELSAYASIMAAHKVLCVEAPKGWEDISAIELDDEKDKQVFTLYEAVQKREDTFRGVAKSDGEGEGEGTLNNLSTMVSETI